MDPLPDHNPLSFVSGLALWACPEDTTRENATATPASARALRLIDRNGIDIVFPDTAALEGSRLAGSLAAIDLNAKSRAKAMTAEPNRQAHEKRPIIRREG
jgi:hypothetical protein